MYSREFEALRVAKLIVDFGNEFDVEERLLRGETQKVRSYISWLVSDIENSKIAFLDIPHWNWTEREIDIDDIPLLKEIGDLKDGDAEDEKYQSLVILKSWNEIFVAIEKWIEEFPTKLKEAVEYKIAYDFEIVKSNKCELLGQKNKHQLNDNEAVEFIKNVHDLLFEKNIYRELGDREFFVAHFSPKLDGGKALNTRLCVLWNLKDKQISYEPYVDTNTRVTFIDLNASESKMLDDTFFVDGRYLRCTLAFKEAMEVINGAERDEHEFYKKITGDFGTYFERLEEGCFSFSNRNDEFYICFRDKFVTFKSASKFISAVKKLYFTKKQTPRPISEIVSFPY